MKAFEQFKRVKIRRKWPVDQDRQPLIKTWHLDFDFCRYSRNRVDSDWVERLHQTFGGTFGNDCQFRRAGECQP